MLCPTLYRFSRYCFALFLLFCTSNIYAQANYQQRSPLENHIIGVAKNVEEHCKITSKLDQSDFIDLPIGIAPKGCGGGTTIIVIDSAYRAEKGGTFFSAYASVVIPGTSKPIAFAARNIGFGKGGLTASSQIKLVLLSAQHIPINENVSLDLPADGHNYVEFDCDGFKAINLKGNFVFSSDLLQPDKDVDKNATQVTASFEINTHDLNNIMATVNITPFRISGLNDVAFEVKDAVVDYSDIINPPGFIFPPGYQQVFGEDIKLWRGFYLKSLIVKVKGLSDSTTSARKPFTIAAQNMLIDDLGVSGLFSATNILPLKEGDADGWPFSINKLSVKVQMNQITGGALEGFVGIPFLGKDTLAYTAMVEQQNKALNYRFSIALGDTVEFNTPLNAKVKIYKGSVIALEKKGSGKLVPSALLHGNISTTGLVNISNIKFENLGLTSQAPYVMSGTFATVGQKPSKGAGFPIQINDIGLKIYNGEVALALGTTLNFMNQEDKGFSGSTRFEILAKMHEEKQTITQGDLQPYTKTNQKWEFEKVKVGDIGIACKTQAFSLTGSLSLYNDDPTYGTGFHGNVAFTIKKVLEQGVKVNAYFGSKNTFRYWHVDGYVPVGNIPIPPAMAITGFMGGASYKMVRQQPLIPDFSQLSVEKAQNVSTGDSQNYAVYLPDSTAGIGFLAGVTLIVGNKNAVNADLMLDVSFNQGGGLKYVRFDGSAFFLTPIESRGRMKDGKAPASSIYANMSMLYDNDNDVFHANMKTYINVAGVLTGVGANGLVGEAVIHADRSDWYAYIGRPSSQFGVNVLGLATAQTYFMVGTKIEGLPLPPSEVREIFQGIDLSLMRDDLAAAGGRGFAAGVHFKLGFDTGDKLKPFYVVASVGAGTDVMLRNYGDAQCVGRDGPIGINGWYASGQAYVFLVGKVGLKVKGKPFDIVSLGLAAVLQAKLPNPAWMKGMLAGNYKILGGLVKGKFNLKFTIGEECEMLNQGAEIQDIVVIADLKPDNNGSDVSVFTAPQVSFNTAIGKDFSMMDLQDNLNAYRIAMDEFSISKDGAKIPGTIRWNNTNDVAVLKTADILPPQSNMHVLVKIHWEKKGSNGLWEPVKDNSNATIYETKESAFVTGTAPNFIPEENVTYSYPVKYQYNLYANESGSGYVKLNYAQEYLFKKTDQTATWDYIVRFKDSRGKVSEVPLTFSLADSKVSFNFPALEQQLIYTMTFVKRPVSGGGIDQNLKRSEVQLSSDTDNQVTTNSNTLQGSITQSVEKEIYSSVFRTSQFSTFRDKWAALGNGNDDFDVARGNVAVIGKRMNTNESFDEFELQGKEGMEPMVQVIASTENTWFKTIISPLLYDLYPYDNDVEIVWRNPATLGVKPLKGVKLTNSISDFKLTDDNVTTGRAPVTNGTMLIGYYLSYYTYWDFNDLSNQVSKKYYDSWTARPEGVRRLMNVVGYTDLMTGSYPVDVKYVLPGASQPSFATQVSIKF